MVRTPLVLQELKREQHVVGGDRRAVGETRLRIEMEGDGAAVVRHLDRLRDEAIERERLIEAARHQALDDKVADPVRRHAAHDQRIETVEGAESAHRQTTALGRIRIDVREMREAGRLFGAAIEGDAVRRRGLRSARREKNKAVMAKRSMRAPGILASGPQSRGTCKTGRLYHMLAPLGGGLRGKLRPQMRCAFATMLQAVLRIAECGFLRPRDCRNPSLIAPSTDASGRLKGALRVARRAEGLSWWVQLSERGQCIP